MRSVVSTAVADSTLNVRSFGAKGDGVANDTAALTAALAAAVVSGATVLLPAGTYKITSMLTWNYQKHGIRGEGAKIDASGVTGIAIKVYASTSVLPEYEAVTHPMTGIRLAGNPSIVSGSVGIQFGNGAGDFAAQCSLRDCTIHDFDKGITFTHNCYLLRFEAVNFFNCNFCIWQTSGFGNAVERTTFSHCNFFNSAQCVYCNTSAFIFLGCSFDYFATIAVQVLGGGYATLIGCHIETSSDGGQWLLCTGSTSNLTVSDTEFYNAGSRVTFPLGFSDSSDGGIVVRNCRFQPGAGSVYNLPSLFSGWCRVSNPAITKPGEFYLWSDFNNELSDGGFEGASPLAEWTVTGDTPVVVSDFAASGTKSLKFAPAAGNSSRIEIRLACRAQAVLTVRYKLRTAFANASDTFSALVGFYNAAAGFVNTSATNVVVHRQGTLESAGAFTIFANRPLIRGITGSSQVRIAFYTNAATGGTSEVRLDDVYIEVL